MCITTNSKTVNSSSETQTTNQNVSSGVLKKRSGNDESVQKSKPTSTVSVQLDFDGKEVEKQNSQNKLQSTISSQTPTVTMKDRLSNIFTKTKGIKLKTHLFSKDVTKTDFTKQVNKVFDKEPTVLTKKEYRSIKNMMENGRSNLNEVLSKAGVASVETLEKVFAKGNDLYSLPITKTQMNKVKELLLNPVIGETETVPKETKVLTKKEIEQVKKDDEAINDIMTKVLPSVDRSNLNSRYSAQDFIFSPEISGIFKKHLASEFSVENMNFVHDLKSALQMGDKTEMKKALVDLKDNFISNNADESINIAYRNRKNTVEVLSNPDSTIENIVKALKPCAKEIVSLINDSFLRFNNQGGTTKGIMADMLLIPAGDGRVEYIQSLENSVTDPKSGKGKSKLSNIRKAYVSQGF